MQPSAPAANPITSNTNMPFGGSPQAASDYGTASNILNYLPTQETQSTNNATKINSNPGSILPNININAPTYTAPTAKSINPASYGTNEAAYNAAVQEAEQNQISAENSTFGAAQGALSSAENQYGNLTPVYQSLASQYNIPGYQNDVATLSGLLQNLNQDVNARTTLGGGAITQSARDEAYTNQAQPLNMALNNASEFLNYGQNDVSNLMDTYEKSLGNQLQPLESNISALPGLFGQANSASEAGYGQGATAIEDTISNAQRQQEIAVSQGNLALQQKAFNAQYGSGTMTDLLNKLANGSIPGMSLKNSGVGGGAGYNFQVNNAPASAGTWAATNNLPINYVLSTMASKGDKNAESALSAITNAGGVTQSIVNQYPDLFWAAGQGQASTNSNNTSKKSTPSAAPKPTLAADYTGSGQLFTGFSGL
jgi:hypothetical protein